MVLPSGPTRAGVRSCTRGGERVRLRKVAPSRRGTGQNLAVGLKYGRRALRWGEMDPLPRLVGVELSGIEDAPFGKNRPSPGWGSHALCASL